MMLWWKFVMVQIKNLKNCVDIFCMYIVVGTLYNPMPTI